MGYQISIGGVQSGPFSEDALRRKLAAGEVAPGDLCWRAGWSEWRPISEALSLPSAPPMLPPRKAETSGMAIASLALGGVAMLICFAAVPAVICGHIARAKIKASRGGLTGAGMALAGLIMGYFTIAVSLVVVPAIIIPTVGEVRENARRTVAMSNLRQIGTASLIYASDNGDKLPSATDGWGYAAELAREAGLRDATFWFAGEDAVSAAGITKVLAENGRDPAPDFRAARLSYALPVGGLALDLPRTTPIAWTRGLRPDGTWAPDSPYRGEGGHILFLGGNVLFARQLEPDTLVRFDGEGGTLDIREALPPGARVFEP